MTQAFVTIIDSEGKPKAIAVTVVGTTPLGWPIYQWQGGGGGSGSPVLREPSYINTTGPGTVAAGAQQVGVLNVGTEAGIWLGQSLAAGIGLSWTVNGDDTLDEFDYDATGTNFLITVTV